MRSATARAPFFYGWIVIGTGFLGMLCASGIRFSFSAFVRPWEAEFGWTREAISLVGSMSLLTWGLAPLIVGFLVDRYGARVVFVMGSFFSGIAAVFSVGMTEFWQLAVTFGIFAGLGAGFTSPVGAAPLAAGWFYKRRGLAVGIILAGISASQIVVVPLLIYLTSTAGWRTALLSVGVVILAVVIPLIFFLVRSDAEAMGLKRYGAADDAAAARVAADDERRTNLLAAMRTRPYWLLALGYFVCGYTTLGFITTHIVPYAVGDLHLTEVNAAQAVVLLGIFDVVGTVSAGYLSDRFGRTVPLGVTYLIRGVSYLVLMNAGSPELLLLWGIVFGATDVASVPLVAQLTGDIFGRRSMGSIYGSIFIVHQIGAAVGAGFGGVAYQYFGSYQPALIVAFVLLMCASAMSFTIREQRRTPVANVAAT